MQTIPIRKGCFDIFYTKQAGIKIFMRDPNTSLSINFTCVNCNKNVDNFNINNSKSLSKDFKIIKHQFSGLCLRCYEEYCKNYIINIGNKKNFDKSIEKELDLDCKKYNSVLSYPKDIFIEKYLEKAHNLYFDESVIFLLNIINDKALSEKLFIEKINFFFVFAITTKKIKELYNIFNSYFDNNITLKTLIKSINQFAKTESSKLHTATNRFFNNEIRNEYIKDMSIYNKWKKTLVSIDVLYAYNIITICYEDNFHVINKNFMFIKKVTYAVSAYSNSIEINNKVKEQLNEKINILINNFSAT